MIDRKALLTDLQKFQRTLEDDLRERCGEVEGVDAKLREQYEEAKKQRRTALAYKPWRDEQLTQIAAAWILGCVFVRFLEDNRLLAAPRLSGPGDARRLATEHQDQYFRHEPSHTNREYLLSVFREVAAYPAAASLFDERHNPLFVLGPSADGTRALVGFWRALDADTGALVHDFTDPALDTRFLGDLYQDLSAEARKRYALLQTPEFVEEFILDRTLDPAIDEFGYREVRLIDPACGSGHFLLGAFHRILAYWRRDDPTGNTVDHAQKALDAVAGVDINPFAIAIARFRLLLAALNACEITSLREAPGFRERLAVGDSLLHGRRPSGVYASGSKHFAFEDAAHLYATEDAEMLREILGLQYHAVVGNPPYITPKDAAARGEYRDRFSRSCHGKYSLGVPFTERFFDLALGADDAAGFVGLITTNSFMKREFGKKLIEQCMPRWDLTHVVDASGAYIPGHGTPTVLLLGRHRRPQAPVVRAVLGIRGEPSTPSDPAKGKVWSSIADFIDHAGYENEFISVADIERTTLYSHPWSLGGGGAGDLKEKIEAAATTRLGDLADVIGITSVTGEDDLYMAPDEVAFRRLGVERSLPLVTGDRIRDWTIADTDSAAWPYNCDFEVVDLASQPGLHRLLWPARRWLLRRKRFGTPMIEKGLTWFEWQELYSDKLRTPLSIAFAFVATHNHFVLDRGGKVFNRSAPVIKLPPDATEDDHLVLLGLLNSSTACFWMKQVFYPKGGDYVGTEGARVRKTLWDERYEFDGTKLKAFPIPDSRPLEHAKQIDKLARDFAEQMARLDGCRTLNDVKLAIENAMVVRTQMVALQEEVDWIAYEIFRLAESVPIAGERELPGVSPGERPFEIKLARRVLAGDESPAWFERHRIEPQPEIPTRWPEWYRELTKSRLRLIEESKKIGLIERPENKRRWSFDPLDELVKVALSTWIVRQIEERVRSSANEPESCAIVADSLRDDQELIAAAQTLRGRTDFDMTKLVTELIESESVPFLAAYRYKPSGLRKREAWEKTWDLQRAEDAIDARTELPKDHSDYLTAPEAAALKRKQIGDIPVPPKYTSADFAKSTYWRHRGKLDVPKERFILYPGAERDSDPTPVIGWAGWNHLEQAKALATYAIERREHDAWDAERLTPLWAGVLELLPWLKQWHNEPEPGQGEGMGDHFEAILEEEIRELGLTREDLRAWRPPEKKRGRAKKSKSKKKTAARKSGTTGTKTTDTRETTV